MLVVGEIRFQGYSQPLRAALCREFHGLHGSLCHGQDGAQCDERVDHISRRTTKIGMDMKTKVDP